MAGKVITPRQLAQQWLRLPNKFEVNVFNFETLVGNAAKKIFRDSFYLRRFNSAGTFSWQSRRNHKPHPILEETGALKILRIIVNIQPFKFLACANFSWLSKACNTQS